VPQQAQQLSNDRQPVLPNEQQQQHQQEQEQLQQPAWPSAAAGHDTIAMVAIDAAGSVAAAASSNGAIHKVPGRVGDAAVPGGGAYADSAVGGCAATGALGSSGLSFS
jgi:isoaspartyl peptidase/L-asparaginase-like protein (Ntn-hydrolase superfamily)